MSPDQKTDVRWLGKNTIRPDGSGKVTGRANFGADIQIPNMLVGKVLRSPSAHTKIKSENLEKAKALPGVKDVITGTNLVNSPQINL